MNDGYSKLVFWLLTSLAVIMTGIGGSAATHLVSQLDSMSIRMSVLEMQNSGLIESRSEMQRRLIRIEDKLDDARVKLEGR